MSERPAAGGNGPEYDALLRRRGGRWHALIPELALAGSGATVAEAHAELEARKEELLKRMAECGAMEDLPPPRRAAGRSELCAELRAFALKAAILCGAAALAGALAAAAVADKLAALSATDLARRNFTALSAEARRLAGSPPEVQRERAEKLRALARALRPYLDAVREELAPEDAKARRPAKGGP